MMKFIVLTPKEEKNHMIILVEDKKAFDNSQYPFMIKPPNQPRIEWTHPNLIKLSLCICAAQGYLSGAHSKHVPHGELSEVSPLKSGIR